MKDKVVKPDFSISTNPIYKLNLDGNFLKKYSCKADFLKEHPMSEHWFYRSIRGKNVVNGEFYISQYSNITHLKLGKKSKIKPVMNLENFNILTNYRNQLILSQNEVPENTRKATAMKNEIIEITRFLCS